MSAHHWSEWLIRLVFGVAGVIHLLPLAGLLGRPLLERAYGIQLSEGQDLVILMQHRALLFGLLAAACLLAVGMPSWRLPAGIAALISMVGFALIAAWQPHGAAIAKVMWIDIGAAVLLALGLLLHVKPSLTS
jgi:hypothetical protein